MSILIQQGRGTGGESFVAVGQLTQQDESPFGQSLMLKANSSISAIPVGGFVIGIARDPVSGRTVVVSQDGEAAELVGEKLLVKPISGPETFGILRGIRCIKGQFVACGMARQVYRLDGDTWHAMDGGLRQLSRDPFEVYGFNALAGPSLDRLWAVGFGQGYRRIEKTWTPLDLPTNVVLNDIVWIEGTRWYAVGQKGVIIAGDDEHSAVVEHDLVSQDLVSVAHFKGNVYAASARQIVRVTTAGIESVSIPLSKNAAITSLDAGSDRLWAFGLNLFSFTFDGDKWESPGAFRTDESSK